MSERNECLIVKNQKHTVKFEPPVEPGRERSRGRTALIPRATCEGETETKHPAGATAENIEGALWWVSTGS